MRAGIALRKDYDAARLRGLAKATRDAGQSRRLLALAEIYDGGSRTKAAQVGGVGLCLERISVRAWPVPKLSTMSEGGDIRFALRGGDQVDLRPCLISRLAGCQSPL